MHLADFPEDLTAAFIPTLKHWYSYQIVYPLALALIKASILATYWRIFTQSTFPRLYLLACGGIIGVYTVIFMFVFVRRTLDAATRLGTNAWIGFRVCDSVGCLGPHFCYWSAGVHQPRRGLLFSRGRSHRYRCHYPSDAHQTVQQAEHERAKTM